RQAHLAEVAGRDAAEPHGLQPADPVCAAQPGDPGAQPHRLPEARQSRSRLRREGVARRGPARADRLAQVPHRRGCRAPRPRRLDTRFRRMSQPIRRIQIATPAMGEEEWLALREPIETGWLTQGPKVAAFEKAFAE